MYLTMAFACYGNERNILFAVLVCYTKRTARVMTATMNFFVYH